VKTTFLVATMVVFCAANAAGRGKVLTKDPLTGLPVIPTTVNKYGGNEQTKIPDAMVCKSKVQGNLYPLIYYIFSKDYNKANATVAATVGWYASRLTGFRKVHGYDSERSQDVFYNADRTILVIATGSPRAKDENTDAYGVTYGRYQPGLSEKTITGLTHGKIICP
jgi:hypothetical protein